VHAPPTHDWPDGQSFPQPPKFPACVSGSTQTPLQSRFSGGHATQSPLEQTCDAGHATPQALQLSWFCCRFTQASPHCVRGAGHTHAPLTQESPAGHASPHAPQCFAFVSGSMQTPSQTRRLAGHGPQSPLEQNSAGAHAASHAPQLSWLESKFSQSAVHCVRGKSQIHSLSTHDWPEGHA
jgi:hypothetical protein